MEIKVIAFALGLLYALGTPTIASHLPKPLDQMMDRYHRGVNNAADQFEEVLLGNRWLRQTMMVTAGNHARRVTP